MSGELIRKVIEVNNACPSFAFEHPLLEKKVADLFANNVIKLLKSGNSRDFRRSILRKVRILCKQEPSDHLCTDDDVTEILMKLYEDFLQSSDKNPTIQETLDMFLVRELKEMNLTSIYAPSIKPETMQALNNLKRSRKDMKSTELKYMFWNTNNNETYLDILKSIWVADILPGLNGSDTDFVIPNDSALKMKPLIEEILLKICQDILDTHIIDLKEWCEDNKDLSGLVKMCAKSSEWFQISSSVLNSTLIKVNFDQQLLPFICMFVKEFVKFQCPNGHISALYPTELCHLVTLLDIDIDKIPTEIKDSYVSSTIERLHKLRNHCVYDFIMLLSHFNQWFSLYYTRFVLNVSISGTSAVSINTRDPI